MGDNWPATSVMDRDDDQIFVGREKEIDQFSHFLQSDNPTKIVNIYGTGGIGKTYLLLKYSRITEANGYCFLLLNSEDFTHTPKDFATYLLTLLKLKGEPVQRYSPNILQSCQHNLSAIAKNKKIVIAIDTYEKMGDLDRWLRQVFIRHLPQSITFVLAGREPLKGEWIDSPAWREVIQQVALTDFTLHQTSTYLAHFGINKPATIESLWQFTDGHPLTLSLAAMTSSRSMIDSQDTDLTVTIPTILSQLTKRWLNEVQQEKLHLLIEAAAVLHHFDQEILSATLKKEVDRATFHELINLSFIKPTLHGWIMHDLIQDAIRLNLKNHKRIQFDELNERAALFYYQRTIKTRSEHDIAQFFYHLGDEFIQSAFFSDSIDTTMYFEQVGAHNFHEVHAFFENKKENVSQSEAAFYSRDSHTTYQFFASMEHNKKEIELMNSNYIQKMGYDVARLLKNEHAETLGLSIIVPINKKTVHLLATEPVSRAYFSRLTETEIKEFDVPEESNAGWFIRMLDYTDVHNVAARSFSLYNLFPLLLSGGKIIISTPLPFFQELIKNFGFQEVPHATHYDYGANSPSPTYMLDVRGAKLAGYLKQFTKGITAPTEDLVKGFNFTPREKEIVKLILEDQTNADIANQLFIAEITVKKHISRILAKTNTKNRTQLTKLILEQG
ncbi:regulatory protein, luxR family [Oceanobacillus limi]|uniref:Regulatory protein, luxR family n=1 Tax=Oceanobacillus limi TaxID=930131 RepID=A0A1I0BJ13_9BACI|nr:LuxR family transcriptional regulator [Oceanobacillus limi]SET06242.1 regulatory protein, luxR family [Oceanobacillus limi]